MFDPTQESFPNTRLRRLRAADWRRNFVRETALSAADFILPLFVIAGQDRREDISALPGVQRLTIDHAVAMAKDAAALGIPAVALFPAIAPELKTLSGAEALNPNNLVCRAVRTIKASVPNIGVMTDVALDPYTSHGHDGVVMDGDVANDATVEILARQAVILAQAGSDIVAPSDMMDGRVGAIRHALEAAGHANTMILSYAVKYASAFYGPFRDAVGSANLLGSYGGPQHKRGYQMDPANGREALREAALDVAEGADLLMVKPAGTSLDIIYRLTQATAVPVVGYQVSGEYAALMAAAAAGALERIPALMESLHVIKRAGASAIVTYGALDIARVLAPVTGAGGTL
ncbi:MAG: porphobilinogen synthase [Rhodospirillaceae bacterium]|nr:porphobilinogen synthase [Rhodospirillaceae bacterium]